MFSLSLILSTVIYLLHVVYSDTTPKCNYARIKVKAYSFLGFTLGTFSLSTDRCQALKGNVDLSFISEDIDGGIKLVCQPDGHGIDMTIYNDPHCSESNSEGSLSIRRNQTIEATFESITSSITLKELECNSIDCSIDFTFAENCSWSNSDTYLNISIPPTQCLSLNKDFSGTLSVVPDDFLPQQIVNSLDSSSYKYGCCSNDDSLLIYNYSDTKCNKEWNKIRISSVYNGGCFDVDGDKFISKWSCASYEDCTDYQFYDVSKYYTPCEDACNEDSSNVDTTQSPEDITTTTESKSVTTTSPDTNIVTTKSSSSLTSAPTSQTSDITTEPSVLPSTSPTGVSLPSLLPTVAVTGSSSINVATGSNNPNPSQTVQSAPISKEKKSSNSFLTKNEVIFMCIGVLLLCILCAFGIYCKRRRHKMNRAVLKENNKISSDKRYEPIIEDMDININDDIINVEPSATATATVIMDTTNDIASVTYDVHHHNKNKSKGKKMKKSKKDQLLN